MPNFASIPFVVYVQAAFGLLLILAIIVAILNLHDYFSRKKLNKLEEELINKNLDKNFGFLHETIQQTQAKINQAADMEIKTLETSRENIERFEGEYKAKLEQTIKEAQEMIVEGNKKTATEVVESFNFYKSSLEQFNKEIEQNMGQLKNQIITSQGDFVGILEKTINLMLREKMRLKDQLDLVYQSLEKAKADKIIV